jgi:Holliday junction DNA helicase RuvA
MIGRAPGVGPKLALRIVTELKDKAAHLISGAMLLRGEAHDGVAPAVAPRGVEADAVAALVKLGYSESIAATAVARAVADLGEADAGVLIREALRSMGKG